MPLLEQSAKYSSRQISGYTVYQLWTSLPYILYNYILHRVPEHYITLFIYLFILYYIILLYITMVYCNLHCIYSCLHLRENDRLNKRMAYLCSKHDTTTQKLRWAGKAIQSIFHEKDDMQTRLHISYSSHYLAVTIYVKVIPITGGQCPVVIFRLVQWVFQCMHVN